MRLLRNNKGTSIVEFAIIAPLLFILLFGILEFGLVLYYKAMITNGSREGARAGIVYRTTPATGAYNPVSVGEITNVVSTYFGGSPPAGLAINVIGGICQDAPNTTLTVQLTYPYTFLVIHRLVTILAGTVTLSAQTVMRCETS